MSNNLQITTGEGVNISPDTDYKNLAGRALNVRTVEEIASLGAYTASLITEAVGSVPNDIFETLATRFGAAVEPPLTDSQMGTFIQGAVMSVRIDTELERLAHIQPR